MEKTKIDYDSLGRNACLFKDAAAIVYGKYIILV
jgi:hypothetical protein